MRAANVRHRRFDTALEQALVEDWTSQLESGKDVWFGSRRMCAVHQIWVGRAEVRALLGAFLEV